MSSPRKGYTIMSEHIGVIGEKISVEVKLVSEYEYTDYSFSYYGTTHYIYTMIDSLGNVFVWKTTSLMSVPRDDDGREWHFVAKGDVIRIEGKVKAHDEYKGTAQTVLTRCKYSLIQIAPTEAEIEAAKRETQIASLTGGDFIWERMPYKQYREHYSDCETIRGSFERDPHGDSTIDVIIREGRLKKSGVRGEHYSGYQFRTDTGALVCYRAISEETARKRLIKDFPNGAEWELVQIFRYDRKKYA